MPECLQQYLGSFFCHDITNFNAGNSEMFRVNTFVNFLFFSRRGENKQATEEILSFPSLKLSKHEIVWKTHTTFFNRVWGDSKKIRCHISVLWTKRENWYYLKNNCHRPLRQECVLHAWIWTRERIVSCWQCYSACVLHIVFYHKEKHLTVVCNYVWNVLFT